MSFIGRQVEVGIGKESVRGTAVAPSFWLPKITASVEDVAEYAEDEQAEGRIEANLDAKVAKQMMAGDVEGLVRDKSFGMILLNLFGSVVTSDNPDADPLVKDHAFSVLQSVQHPALTVALKHPVENLRFALSMINELTITAELGNFVGWSASFMGKKGVVAVDTPAYDTAETEFVAQHVVVKFATDLAGLDVATAIKAKSVVLTFAKNVESDDIIGSIAPNDFLNKEFRLSGTIELLIEDTTFKALHLAGTKRAVRVELKNTDVTIGATANPTLQIDMARVFVKEYERADANADLTRQALTLEAYYSSSDAKMVTAKLTNKQASY